VLIACNNCHGVEVHTHMEWRDGRFYEAQMCDSCGHVQALAATEPAPLVEAVETPAESAPVEVPTETVDEQPEVEQPAPRRRRGGD